SRCARWPCTATRPRSPRSPTITVTTRYSRARSALTGAKATCCSPSQRVAIARMFCGRFRPRAASAWWWSASPVPTAARCGTSATSCSVFLATRLHVSRNATSSLVIRSVNSSNRSFAETGPQPRVAVLTGGQDAPYARGLIRELLARRIDVACVGSDELADCDFVVTGRLEFHNLVGSQESTNLIAKVWRVLRY